MSGQPPTPPASPAEEIDDVEVAAQDESTSPGVDQAALPEHTWRPDVAVIGVGGAGVNAVSRLLDLGLEGVDFVAIDTSGQTLLRANGARRIGIGSGTKSLGTGGSMEIGRDAAQAHQKEIAAALDGADLVFVTAGLSGGTGGGAAPVVARIARDLGAVVVGFGVTPFAFEAPRRAAHAEQARRDLASSCDATVILDNQRALEIAGKAVSLDVALRVADDVLRQAVQGLSELVSECGPINVDLAVVRDVLAEGGECCLALGIGRGERPAAAAMTAALESPLIDMDALGRAPAVLVQVTGGADLSVHDTADAVALLQGKLDADCRLVVGTGFDPTLTGACQITILGTGLKRTARMRVDWSEPAQDWRSAAGLPPKEPRRSHRFELTGKVMPAPSQSASRQPAPSRHGNGHRVPDAPVRAERAAIPADSLQTHPARTDAP